VTVEVSLAGKVALVTGVGPNIGSGIALALAKYGAKVACNDVSAEAIKACIARIERNGGEAMAAPGDVTDEATVQGYINDVLARWGRLDILVNNAALLGGMGVLDETAEAFERAVRVSSLGYFLNTKHAGRAMAERGIKGSIVCISSSNGWSGTAGVIAYAFHKGGVNNFVRAAAMDLAPYGIRVNSCSPTWPGRAWDRAVCSSTAGPADSADQPATSRGGARAGRPASGRPWCRWAPLARLPTSDTRSRGCARTTPGSLPAPI
jgi:NAD(P)-dependent dehydrogenase (short-subunit alcohol dehydrogenase family)